MNQIKETEQRIRDLCRVYTDNPQIGLVVGAGISVDSIVPLYLDMAVKLFEKADQAGRFRKETPIGALAFLRDQAKLLERRKDLLRHAQLSNTEEEKQKYEIEAQSLYECVKQMLRPEEVAQFVRYFLADEEGHVMEDLVNQALYEHVKKTKTHKGLERPVYMKNDTLNAIITFCAVFRDWSAEPHKTAHVEANPKVGGILTTNYDFLIEGAFGSKFKLRRRLRAVGRASSRELDQHHYVIPVYHVHGCVSYVPQELRDEPQPAKLVIAEEDYFKIFYDPLGFGNYIAMSFLRKFPCLFIGSAMTDSNLRRFLYHLREENAHLETPLMHYAILRKYDSNQQDYQEAVLKTYHVIPIWIDSYKQIPSILEQIYTSAGDSEIRHQWNQLFKYRTLSELEP